MITIFVCEIENDMEKLKEPLGRITGRINRVFFGTLQKKLSHLDIDRSFYPLLIIASRDGELTQKDLAEELSSDKVQIVRIINYLSENGYVERVQNEKDRRKYKLHLTEKGRKAIPDIQKTTDELSNIAFKDMPEENVEQLYRMLNTIENNLLCLKNEVEE